MTERLHFNFHTLEKEMATHSSVLAWRIPGMGQPDRLPSGVAQSRTRLKQLSSSSSSILDKGNCSLQIPEFCMRNKEGPMIEAW